MAKDKLSKMSPQKKSRRLFWGTLAPLLTVTIVACTFFYNISNKILQYYVKAELQGSVEKLNSSILERMDPIIVNLQNFSNFATLTDDDTEVLNALVKTFATNLEYASSFYYASTVPLNRGGFFLKATTGILHQALSRVSADGSLQL